jgi:hypothetical protein
MTTLPYRIYDADNHCFEPDDCFTRHIEAHFRERSVWIDRSCPGTGTMFVGDERCQFFSVGAGDSVGPPGAMKEFLRGRSEEGGSPSLRPIDGLAVPEFTDRKVRLAKMDDVVALAKLLGADPVLNGSDYPHPEGPLWPAEFADECEGLPDADVRKITRENLAGLVV